MQKYAVSQPEEHAGEIESQHAVREVAAALAMDFDDLRDEGKGGAEPGGAAEDFDRLPSEHLKEIPPTDSNRGGGRVCDGPEKKCPRRDGKYKSFFGVVSLAPLGRYRCF